MTYDYDGVVKILFVLIIVTGAMIIGRRTLTSLFLVYAVQSFLIALVALVVFLRDGNLTLLVVTVLTVLSKVFVIPYVMYRVQNQIKIRRDLEFRYLTPVSSIILSALLIILVYKSFSQFPDWFLGDALFSLGAVIGVSLTLMGMLVIFSRKKTITKILGYLTMENGALLFSLFIAELPFIIEFLIIIDLIVLILLSTILAFGIDSTLEEFHRRLQIPAFWLKKSKP